ncbi:MAG: hypothetical protein Q8N83_05760 [Ignavibacteria bacterium]|nr:hypothetical protein [Ignavibacteria bacterium]
MSRLVAIEKLVDGMETNQAVKNKFGQMLIPAKTQITETHKKVLRTWGITSIDIKDDSSSPPDLQPTDNQKTEGLELLYRRFSWFPRNANEEDLFEMLLSLNIASDNRSIGENR